MGLSDAFEMKKGEGGGLGLDERADSRNGVQCGYDYCGL